MQDCYLCPCGPLWAANRVLQSNPPWLLSQPGYWEGWTIPGLLSLFFPQPTSPTHSNMSIFRFLNVWISQMHLCVEQVILCWVIVIWLLISETTSDLTLSCFLDYFWGVGCIGIYFNILITFIYWWWVYSACQWSYCLLDIFLLRLWISLFLYLFA